MKQNKNRLLFLTGVLFVIIAGLLLKDTILKYTQKDSEQVFPELNPESVTEIQIQDEEKETQLVKKDGSWIVLENGMEFRADQDRIQTLLTNMQNLEKGDIVSENKEKHKDFGIEKKQIVANQGDKKYTLFIGNSPQLSSAYVRVGDSSEIFIAEGFGNVYTPPDYRDLQIPFVEQEENVQTITVEAQGTTLSMEKKDDTWYIGEEEAQREEMSFYVNALRTIRASNILANNPLEGNVLAPTLTIRITENDEEKILQFYPKEETIYYAKRQDRSIVYEVEQGTVESLTKAREDLVKTEEE